MHALAKAAFALALLGAAAPALAAPGGGGGGGGGMSPSPSQREDPAAAYQAGVTALNAQNYREAIRQFRSARRAAPNNGAINYALGLSYAGNGDKDEARDAFARAVRDETAPVAARLQLGLTELELGNREAALAQQTALAAEHARCSAEPSPCDANRRAQVEAAHAQLTQALEAPTTDPATTGWNLPDVEQGRAAYAEAVGLINQERFSEAFGALERAELAFGPHPDVLNYMGFVTRKLGDLDGALAYYDRALALDPNHLGATEYLGELYIQIGEMTRARGQLAQLDRLCAYGCAEREELARWIARAE